MATQQKVSRAAVVCGTLGLIALIIGSVGPWETTVFGEVAGTRGDGAITLVLGIVAALALAAGQLRSWSLVGAAAVLVAALGVAGYDAIHIEQGLHHATLFGHQVAAAGWGVYLAVAGAAIALAGLAAIAIPVRATRYLAMALPVVAGVGIFAAGAAIESHRTSRPESVSGTFLSTGSCSARGIPRVVSPISFTNGTCSAARSAVRKVESGDETWTFVGRPYGAQPNGAANINATSVKGAQCTINSTPGENHWSCSGQGSSLSWTDDRSSLGAQLNCPRGPGNCSASSTATTTTTAPTTTPQTTTPAPGAGTPVNGRCPSGDALNAEGLLCVPTTRVPGVTTFTPGDQNPNDARASACESHTEVGPHSSCSVAQQIIDDFTNASISVGPVSSPPITADEGSQSISFICYDVGGAGGPASGEYIQCISQSDPQDWFEFVQT